MLLWQHSCTIYEPMVLECWVYLGVRVWRGYTLIKREFEQSPFNVYPSRATFTVIQNCPTPSHKCASNLKCSILESLDKQSATYIDNIFTGTSSFNIICYPTLDSSSMPQILIVCNCGLGVKYGVPSPNLNCLWPKRIVRGLLYNEIKML